MKVTRHAAGSMDLVPLVQVLDGGSVGGSPEDHWHASALLLPLRLLPPPLPSPPTTITTLKALLSLRVPVLLSAPAADIMCDVGRVGAAKRRRDRQLRAFHGHDPPPQRSTSEVKSGGAE